MINNRPKGIKIDPSRLHLKTTKSEPKSIFTKYPKDKKQDNNPVSVNAQDFEVLYKHLMVKLSPFYCWFVKC